MATQIYKLGEPIVMPIPTTDDYKIFDSRGKTRYVGRITAMPNQIGIPQVDIAPIMRQIVPMPNYGQVLQDVDDNNFGYTTEPKTHRYTLVTAPTNPNSAALEQRTVFGVCWDYMSPWARQGFRGLLGGGIQDYVLLDQIFGTSFDGEAIGISNSEHNPGTTAFWTYDLQDNYEILISDPRTDEELRTYEVKHCYPDNACILYYVDGDGGLAWVICDAKNTTTDNVERDQITHNDIDIDNPTRFGIDNYRITAYKSYTLNTGYLTDKQSERLQWLFKSPKVWLYKIGIFSVYNAGERSLQSVVITDKKMQIKRTRSNGKLFNYRIQCRDSQTLEIIG